MILSGTGHRPHKIEDPSKLYEDIVFYLRIQKPSLVISGLCIGFDTLLAEAAIFLDIPLKSAIPFPEQAGRWSLRDQRIYQNLKDQSQECIILQSSFSYEAYQLRNEYMVNSSDKIVAYWNGTSGGTCNCVRYAEQRGKPVDNLFIPKIIPKEKSLLDE